MASRLFRELTRPAQRLTRASTLSLAAYRMNRSRAGRCSGVDIHRSATYLCTQRVITPLCDTHVPRDCTVRSCSYLPWWSLRSNMQEDGIRSCTSSFWRRTLSASPTLGCSCWLWYLLFSGSGSAICSRFLYAADALRGLFSALTSMPGSRCGVHGACYVRLKAGTGCELQVRRLHDTSNMTIS